MAFDIFIEITYFMESGTFKINTNVESDALSTVISDFLHAMVGTGADHSEPEEREEYRIKVEVDLNGDVFRASDDIGNNGLRDGILLDVLGKLDQPSN